jgi:hypothetical protein
MSSRLNYFLLALVFLATSAASPASATDHCLKKDKTLCTDAGHGGFGVGQIHEDSDGNGVSVGGSVTSPGRPKPTTLVEKQYVPTCTGNAAEDGGVLCNAAVQTCPVEGEVRFWVYTRVVTIATGAATPWTRVTDPPSVCLGPNEPALDPLVAIPALVQRDFQRVVVLKGVAEVSPQPDTLVNIPTVFTTSTPRNYDIPLSLLGQSVVITATAERYTWHFGDGASLSTSEPGGRVEYEYSKAGARQAYVVIEWSGAFRVNGGAAQPIAGRATTTGEPTDVQVKQARTELVRD